jgi:nucleoside-diphosphate-sugar epimerase
MAMRHVLNVVDVRDVAKALVGAVENGSTGDPILVSGHNVTMTMLYRWIFDIAGVRRPFLELPDEAVLTASYLWESWSTATNLPVVVHHLSPLIVSLYSALEVSPRQRALGASPRDLSGTLTAAVDWYRRIGYC